MSDLTFFVPGRAIPQGSKTMGQTKTGRAYMRDASSTALKPWRSDIAKIAANVARLRHWTPPDHVHAHLVFRFQRPAAHFRTGRNAHLLRADAPMYPNVKPDGDKLVRACFDALTAAGVVRDDATIVSHYAAKQYCADGQRPGVAIILTNAAQPAQEALL